MTSGTPDDQPHFSASSEANQLPRSSPTYLHLGVILWSDDTEEDPTVIADRSPVALAHTMAVMIHEMIEDASAYAGATDFLESNPPPQDWVLPEDVDDWLEALREATPYPSYSFHQIPTTGGADGTNRTVVNRHLDNALQRREESLSAETPNDPTHQPPGPARSL